MASADWTISFPHAKVSHIDDNFSDHLSILLRLNFTGKEFHKRVLRRRFENMWVTDNRCESVVSNSGLHDVDGSLAISCV